MIYGYLRVSTDKQDLENQKQSVLRKAEELNVTVQKWIEDFGVSGAKEPDKRMLGSLLKKIKEDDVVIVSELSRLGRKMFMIMRILEHLMKIGAKCYSVKDGYVLGDNIQSKVLAFAFGLAAEIERNLIQQRTKEALERKRAEGVVLGRPIGSKSKKKKLSEREGELLGYLQKGLSYSAIARLMNVHRLTLAQTVVDCGFTKYRANYQAYSAVSERNHAKAQTKIKISQRQRDVQLLDNELLRMYEECNHSLVKLGERISLSLYETRKLVVRRGLWEKIVELNFSQRSKHNPKKASESK